MPQELPTAVSRDDAYSLSLGAAGGSCLTLVSRGQGTGHGAIHFPGGT